eukprot:403341576
MGNILSNHVQIAQTNANRTAKKYDKNANIVLKTNLKSIKLSLFEFPLVPAITNNGWKCSGEKLLQGGCQSGFGVADKTFGAIGYFEFDSDIAFCNACILRVDKEALQWQTKWHGWYDDKDDTGVLDIECLQIFGRYVRGKGFNEKYGPFYITGQVLNDFYENKFEEDFSYDIKMIYKFPTPQYAITFEGEIKSKIPSEYKYFKELLQDKAKEKLKIDGNLLIGNTKQEYHIQNVRIASDKNDYERDAKIAIIDNSITDIKPFNMELQFGTLNNGWICDGDQVLKTGCSQGFNMKYMTKDVQAYFGQNQEELSFCKSCAKNLQKGGPEIMKNVWYSHFQKNNQVFSAQVDLIIYIRKSIKVAFNSGQGAYYINAALKDEDDRKFCGDLHFTNSENDYETHFIEGILKEGGKVFKFWFEQDNTTQFKVYFTQNKEFQDKPSPVFEFEIPDGYLLQLMKKEHEKLTDLVNFDIEELRYIFNDRDLLDKNIDPEYCTECNNQENQLCDTCLKIYFYILNTNYQQKDKQWEGTYKYWDAEMPISLDFMVIRKGVIMGRGMEGIGQFVIIGKEYRNKIKFQKFILDKWNFSQAKDIFRGRYDSSKGEIRGHCENYDLKEEFVLRQVRIR